jgi:hypothetical protein
MLKSAQENPERYQEKYAIGSDWSGVNLILKLPDGPVNQNKR